MEYYRTQERSLDPFGPDATCAFQILKLYGVFPVTGTEIDVIGGPPVPLSGLLVILFQFHFVLIILRTPLNLDLSIILKFYQFPPSYSSFVPSVEKNIWNQQPVMPQACSRRLPMWNIQTLSNGMCAFCTLIAWMSLRSSRLPNFFLFRQEFSASWYPDFRDYSPIYPSPARRPHGHNRKPHFMFFFYPASSSCMSPPCPMWSIVFFWPHGHEIPRAPDGVVALGAPRARSSCQPKIKTAPDLHRFGHLLTQVHQAGLYFKKSANSTDFFGFRFFLLLFVFTNKSLKNPTLDDRGRSVMNMVLPETKPPHFKMCSSFAHKVLNFFFTPDLSVKFPRRSPNPSSLSYEECMLSNNFLRISLVRIGPLQNCKNSKS